MKPRVTAEEPSSRNPHISWLVARGRWLVLFLLAAFAVAADQQVTEKLDVEVVNVYLSATDSDGHFLKDLRPDELLVKEDGVPQKITNFTNFGLGSSDKLGEKGIPLTVAFVIDESGSMADPVNGAQQKIDIVKNAAFKLIDELKPEDQVMLIAFADHPEEITPLTTDKKQFGHDLLFEDAKGGNTALLDSVYYAMEKIKDVWGRKIIVVCSDGQDTASYLKLDEVVSNVVASDITILAFGTMELTTSSLRGRYILEKLTNASGGYAFFPSSVKMLQDVMEKLRQGMNNQYSIGYRPISRKAGWRKIEISTTRHHVKLRYREGYYGAPVTQ